MILMALPVSAAEKPQPKQPPKQQPKVSLDEQVAASGARARVKCPEAFTPGTALQSAFYDVAFHYDQTRPGWRNDGNWPEKLIDFITRQPVNPEWHTARRLAEMKTEEAKYPPVPYRAAPPVEAPMATLITAEWKIQPELIPRAVLETREVGAVRVWLTSLGVQFNGAASAIYLPGPMRLIVRNTQDQLDLVDQISRTLKPEAPSLPATPEVAIVQTDAGDMVFEFWPNQAPKTVANFIWLAKSGFYDGTAFHRVIKDFMIQGGDPLSKDPSQEAIWGTGGSGRNVRAEFNASKHEFGVLSMARTSDPDSGSSQFFICLGTAPALDGKYTAFGRLIKGEAVLRRLAETPVGLTAQNELSRPKSRVEIRRISITGSVPTDRTPNDNTDPGTGSRPRIAGTARGFGTGFFITDDGYIVTNAHVVKGANRVQVMARETALAAKVIKVDEANDLALLKVEGRFASLPVAASRSVRLGNTVATVGFPNPMLQGISPKLAKGEIAALAGIQDDARHFQISVPVQPGNSGGALVDERGNVVGVVCAKLDSLVTLETTGELPQNLSYAIKSSYLLSFLESLPSVAAKIKEPTTKEQKFEDTVNTVEQSTALIVVE